jgi:hypothetical protein
MLNGIQSFIRKLHVPTLGLSTADGSEEYRLWGKNDNTFLGFAPTESLKHKRKPKLGEEYYLLADHSGHAV